jgi:hypothetical protein
MASNKADTLKISESLSENPRLKYATWKTAVLQWAITHRINGFDLTDLLLTNEEYEVKFPAIAGILQPRLPIFPARLVGNATTTAALNWKYDTEIANSAVTLTASFKEAILTSVGPAISREFAHPTRGYIDIEIHEIMILIERGYGTVTEADIRRLHENLVIDEAKSWRDNVANFRSIFILLAPVGQFTTDLDKRTALDKATMKTKYAPLLEAYKNLNPLLAERTFDLQCLYIEQRESNLSASAAGYAGKAESNNESLKAEIAALTATVAALSMKPASTASPPNPPSQGQRGGRGGGRTQGRGRGRGRNQQEMYCFHHGRNRTHMGTECTTMANDTSYTQPMKTASAPCVIDGYYGKN